MKRRLLSISVATLPVSWKRVRGSSTRYKPVNVKAWQEFLAEICKEEITMSEDPSLFPYAGPVEISIEVLYPDDNALHRLGDPDNIEKAIFDALTGIVIKDDRLRYIRRHSLTSNLALSEEEVGTHIGIYSLSSLR